MYGLVGSRLVNHAAVKKSLLQLSAAHASKLASKKQPTDYALEHFDAFYTRVFGVNAWRSMRIALLSKKKHCAVLNPFAMAPDLVERMRGLGCQELMPTVEKTSEGDESTRTVSEVEPTMSLEELPEPLQWKEKEVETATLDDNFRIIKKGNTEPLLSFVPATEMVYQEEVIDEGDYFNFLKPDPGSEVAIKSSQPLPMLPLLAYTFPSGSIGRFPPPTKPMDGLFEYYLMDAASLLPVMALDLKTGDDFADFCAGPGGKTLAVAFLRKARTHLCTDVSPGRVRRLRSVLETYLPEEQRERITTKHIDMTLISDGATYDKILVDVPCTSDRHALEESEGSLFHPMRTSERLRLPEKQKGILTHALQRLRVGGAAVYSTCSLSPVQNDSVVHMTLQSFKQMKFVVTRLDDAFAPLAAQGLFRFYSGCRYGQLVMPYLPSNFGPMYICRIERIL